MAYTTLATLKEYLGIAVADVDDDTLLSSFIPQAESEINHFCRRVFESTSVTKTYTSELDTSGDILYLDADLLTLTSITVDGTSVAISDVVLHPTNNPPYSSLKIKSTSSSDWGSDDDEISINGTWGYSTVVPPNIAYITHRLCAYWYRKKDAQTFDDAAFSQAGTVVSPTGLPKDITEMLKRYRRRQMVVV